jgi:hypothetical protein
MVKTLWGADSALDQNEKAVREAYIRQRARELAKSGKYQNWHTIEAQLRFREDWYEARGALDNNLLRDELDVLCQRATGKPAYATFLIPAWLADVPAAWKEPS